MDKRLVESRWNVGAKKLLILDKFSSMYCTSFLLFTHSFLNIKTHIKNIFIYFSSYQHINWVHILY